MRVIILKGRITGSVIIGDSMRIKLSSDIAKSRLVYGNNDVLKICKLDSKNFTINIPKIDIDRCMILDDDDSILSFGATSGGVDKTKLLLFADREKRKENDNVLNNHSEYCDNATYGDMLNRESMQNQNNESLSINIKQNKNAQESIMQTSDVDIENIGLFDKLLKEGSYSEDKTDFYNSIEKDIEKMMEIYPHNILLENLVFDSNWIDVDVDSKRYALGVIKNNGIPQVIAYGIPCDDYELSKDKYKNYDYLPLDRHNPYKNGYFIVYQNAKDGSILQAK